MDIHDETQIHREIEELFKIANVEVCKTFVKGPRGVWRWRKGHSQRPWVTTVQIIDTLVKRVQEQWNSELLPALHGLAAGPMDDPASAYYTAFAILKTLELGAEDMFGRWQVPPSSTYSQIISDTAGSILSLLKKAPEANKEAE